jgi:hypothetical protein
MKMVLYRPRFRHPDGAAKPPNLAEAESIEPGLNPVFADLADLAVDVETPSGEVLSVDDPKLIRELDEGLGAGHALTLTRSERAMTDCRPVSLFSVQTGRQLGEELGIEGRMFSWTSRLREGSPRTALLARCCALVRRR